MPQAHTKLAAAAPPIHYQLRSTAPSDNALILLHDKSSRVLLPAQHERFSSFRVEAEKRAALPVIHNPAEMADAHAGVKRPHSAIDGQLPHKRRRVHRLRHIQRRPSHTEPAPQGGVAPAHTPDTTRDQLLKSLGSALALAGFDSARPEALEMLREHTEEYMRRFARYIRTSMHGMRRVRPTAQDFSMALAQMPNTSTASLLTPHLRLPIADSISCPAIPPPEPESPSAPDLSRLLQPLVSQRPPSYIPRHFPALPPQHTWQATPVYTEREKDSRRMRELMTQEGVMAEQALRRLATAAKAATADTLKAERSRKRRGEALSGVGKVRRDGGGAGVGRRGAGDRLDAFADVLKDVSGDGLVAEGEEDLAVEGKEGRRGDDVDIGMPEGVVVNYDMGHWRHGRKTVRL